MTSGPLGRWSEWVNGEVHGVGAYVEFEDAGALPQDGSVVSIDAVIPVTQGLNNITLNLRRSTGTALLFVQSGSITTIFVPFGSVQIDGAPQDLSSGSDANQ